MRKPRPDSGRARPSPHSWKVVRPRGAALRFSDSVVGPPDPWLSLCLPGQPSPSSSCFSSQAFPPHRGQLGDSTPSSWHHPTLLIALEAPGRWLKSCLMGPQLPVLPPPDFVLLPISSLHLPRPVPNASFVPAPTLIWLPLALMPGPGSAGPPSLGGAEVSLRAESGAACASPGEDLQLQTPGRALGHSHCPRERGDWGSGHPSLSHTGHWLRHVPNEPLIGNLSSPTVVIIRMTTRNAQVPHFHSCQQPTVSLPGGGGGRAPLPLLPQVSGQGRVKMGEEHHQANVTAVALGEDTPLSGPQFPPGNDELELRFPGPQHIHKDHRL